MSRPPTPLAQISPASAVHNKGRIEARLRSAVPIGSVGRPPKYFDKLEKRIWKELVESAPAVLGKSDRVLLEIACHLKAKLEARTIGNSELSTLISCLNKLGLIPTDRPAVAVKKEESAWDEI